MPRVALNRREKSLTDAFINAGGHGHGGGGRGGYSGRGRGYGYGYYLPYAYPYPYPYYLDDTPVVIEGENDFPYNAEGQMSEVEVKKIWQKINDMPDIIKFLPLLGIAGGLYYAYSKNSSASAYVGFALVGAIVLAAPYNFYLLQNTEKLNSTK